MRLEEDRLPEQRLVLEVEADPQVVEIAAELECVLLPLEAPPLADLLILLDADVVAAHTLQGLPHSLPGPGQGRPHQGQLLQAALDRLPDLVQAPIVRQVDAEGLLQVGEASPQPVLDRLQAFSDDLGGRGFDLEVMRFQVEVLQVLQLQDVGRNSSKWNLPPRRCKERLDPRRTASMASRTCSGSFDIG